MKTLSALKIDEMLPATFTAPGVSESEFLELAAQFGDARVEYTSDGTVIVMPPTDPENGARGTQVIFQLMNWAERQKTGHVCGPDSGFFFRSGARRSPDAAWFSDADWKEAKKALRGKDRFPVFAPEFVIEIRSPDDRLRPLWEKMEEYIANGVKLGWLIDPLERTVTIYRAGQAPETLNAPERVQGDGPVQGFVLELKRVFNPVP